MSGWGKAAGRRFHFGLEDSVAKSRIVGPETIQKREINSLTNHVRAGCRGARDARFARKCRHNLLLIMQIDTAITFGGYLGMMLAGAAACYERVRNARLNSNREISRAKDELVRVLTEDRDAWKDRCTTEREEFAAYRVKSHDNANDAQARIIKLTEELGTLRAKTDITPLLKNQEEQSRINAKLLEGLEAIIRHLKQGQ
jgi:hypothetical protein